MDKVFIYYHCDIWKSTASMRLKKVFADTINGRKALANLIIRDIKDDAIELDALTKKEIANICVNQTPIILNDYMTYGHIVLEDVEG